MTTLTRILTATTVAGALAIAGGVLIGTAEAGSPGSADPAAPGQEKVASVHYTLGDAAFQVPGFHRDPSKPELADIELTGIVHYPQGLGGGPRPVVLLIHGQQDTCADRNAPQRPLPTPPPADAATPAEGATPAEDAGPGVAGDAELDPLLRWPCAPGTPSLPSYRGYDYLGRNLASRGFVALSISANGVNAGELGDPADLARAALINKHLAMWAQLTGTGGGPLAGRFTDPESSAPRSVDFRGKLDMTRVGTLGHSRGGRGVMWHAAEKHRAEWPRGVQVKAALPLAPAGIFNPDDPEVVANYQLTSIPFLQWEGMCDYGAHGEYFDAGAKQNRAVSRELRVHGANHNFLNTEWSPSSGQVSAYDDADYGRRPAPGQCTTTLGEETAERQLTEDEERRVATGYVSAFFRRYLTGDTRMDAILDGKQQPYSSVTRVDARIQAR